MSNGMYCSASQRIDSLSSAGVITGRLIFFTMTALPESDAATSLVLNALFSNSRLMASVTALPSMIAPSTIASGGTGSVPNAATLNPFPAGFSSTALTALEPMSSPTHAFALPNPNTVMSYSSSVQWMLLGKLGTRLDRAANAHFCYFDRADQLQSCQPLTKRVRQFPVANLSASVTGLGRI